MIAAIAVNHSYPFSFSSWKPGQLWTPIICGIATVGALVVAGYGIALAIQLWRVLPFWDQWQAVRIYQAWTTGALSFFDLVAQHNEHRIPLTNLAFLVDFAFFQGRSAFTHSLLLLVHVGLGATLGLVATRGLTANERALGVAAGMAFLVAPVQIGNLTLPFHLSWAASGLFALGAFFWTARLAGPMPHGGRATIVALAAASTVLAVYASANGLAVAPLVTVMAFVLPVGREARIVLVAAAALSIASYFVGYTVPPYHAAFHASLGSRDGVLQFLYYIAAFLGSVAQHSLKVSFLLGIIGLAVWAAVTFALLSRLRFGGPLDPSAVALLLLATLAIATAVMTALGRAGMGPEQGMSSRYATWSVLFWASLAGSAWRLADAARRPVVKIATLGVAAWLLGLSYFSGQDFVNRAKEHAVMLDAVTAELRAGRIVPEHLAQVYPHPDIVLLIEFLRAHRLSIFAD